MFAGLIKRSSDPFFAMRTPPVTTILRQAFFTLQQFSTLRTGHGEFDRLVILCPVLCGIALRRIHV